MPTLLINPTPDKQTSKLVWVGRVLNFAMQKHQETETGTCVLGSLFPLPVLALALRSSLFELPRREALGAVLEVRKMRDGWHIYAPPCLFVCLFICLFVC